MTTAETPASNNKESASATSPRATAELHEALRSGNQEALVSAISKGADVNARMTSIVAARGGIHRTSCYGVTPLIYAAASAWDLCVAPLLAARADLYAETTKGRIALTTAEARRAACVGGRLAGSEAELQPLLVRFDAVIEQLTAAAVAVASAEREAEMAAAAEQAAKEPAPVASTLPVFALAPKPTGGTGNPPYRPTQERESVSGKEQAFNYLSISQMPEFQNKSFEELRAADYARGNKGTGGGVFGGCGGGGGGGVFGGGGGGGGGVFGGPAPAAFPPSAAPGALNAYCAAARQVSPEQKEEGRANGKPHTCKNCGGKFNTCFGSYGTREKPPLSTWLSGTSSRSDARPRPPYCHRLLSDASCSRSPPPVPIACY